jgi:hypothetical protein
MTFDGRRRAQVRKRLMQELDEQLTALRRATDHPNIVEVKCRGDGFRRLYDWLDGADFLIVKADRLEPLVVLPLKLAAEIAAIAERQKEAGR